MLSDTCVVSERKIIKIEIRPAAKAAIERFCETYNMKEYAVASKMYEWFAEQDDIFQRAVMGMLHGLEVDAAREFMRRIASRTKTNHVAAAPHRIGKRPNVEDQARNFRRSHGGDPPKAEEESA